MTDALLLIHSLTRWLVLIAFAATAARCLRILMGAPAPGRLLLPAVILLDLQLLLGALLFVVSGRLATLLESTGAVMRNDQLRASIVEHPSMMVLAALSLHASNVLVKKTGGKKSRATRALLGIAVATVLVLVGISRVL